MTGAALLLAASLLAPVIHPTTKVKVTGEVHQVESLNEWCEVWIQPIDVGAPIPFLAHEKWDACALTVGEFVTVEGTIDAAYFRVGAPELAPRFWLLAEHVEPGKRVKP